MATCKESLPVQPDLTNKYAVKCNSCGKSCCPEQMRDVKRGDYEVPYCPRCYRVHVQRLPEPNLTLEQALEQFPEECKMLIGDVPGGEASFERQKAYIARWGMYRLRSSDLAWAALRWLAGREFNSLAVTYEQGRFVDYRWPKYPLRWLLEEVREQLKWEKT